MAKIGVSFKIDVTKIDKARLYVGKKGTYLDATVFIDLDELDQYGNSGMISQSVSQEERQAGTKGEVLGDSKVFWRDEGQAPQARAPVTSKTAPLPDPVDDFEDDIPFN
jgi:hypothetical protein